MVTHLVVNMLQYWEQEGLKLLELPHVWQYNVWQYNVWQYSAT